MTKNKKSWDELPITVMLKRYRKAEDKYTEIFNKHNKVVREMRKADGNLNRQNNVRSRLKDYCWKRMEREFPDWDVYDKSAFEDLITMDSDELNSLLYYYKYKWPDKKKEMEKDNG